MKIARQSIMNIRCQRLQNKLIYGWMKVSSRDSPPARRHVYETEVKLWSLRIFCGFAICPEWNYRYISTCHMLKLCTVTATQFVSCLKCQYFIDAINILIVSQSDGARAREQRKRNKLWCDGALLICWLRSGGRVDHKRMTMMKARLSTDTVDCTFCRAMNKNSVQLVYHRTINIWCITHISYFEWCFWAHYDTQWLVTCHQAIIISIYYTLQHSHAWPCDRAKQWMRACHLTQLHHIMPTTQTLALAHRRSQMAKSHFTLSTLPPSGQCLSPSASLYHTPMPIQIERRAAEKMRMAVVTQCIAHDKDLSETQF